MNNVSFIRHECIILDACSVINLYATGLMPEIIRSLPARCAVSRYVKEHEAKAVYEAADGNGNRKRVPIELDEFIRDGALELCHHNSPSIASTIVVLASAGIRGMGEKISGAIALENGWGIVLDDHNATTKLEAHMPTIQALTTLDLLRFWADQTKVSDTALRRVLINLKIRGNYDISKRHHLYTWAVQYVEDMDRNNE